MSYLFRGYFLELMEGKISQFLQSCNVEAAACQLRHPGQIKTLQSRRRNCLILPSCFQNTPEQKVMGWGAASREASAARLLSCSILSLYHLIRRMWRCGEESLSAWVWEGGATVQLSLPWPSSLLHMAAACVDDTALGGGWGRRGVTGAPGNASDTNGCGKSEDGKACFICAWKKKHVLKLQY